MKRNNKTSITVIILIFLSVINIYSLLNKINSNVDKINDNFDNYDEKVTRELKKSDYSSIFEGIGDEINVSLHQSLLNKSIISFSNLSSINSFTEPCPTVTGFNSSFINITIDDIKANNISKVIEDTTDDGDQNCATPQVSSFRVDGSCYLINVSVRMRVTGNGDFDIYLHRAEWDTGNSRIEPIGTPTLIGTHLGNIDVWVDFDISDRFLNNSNTYNNTWFIGVNLTGGGVTWKYANDIVPPGDSIAYEYGGAGSWSSLNYDYWLKYGLAPLNTTPSPEQVDLRINSTQVIGYGDGIGAGYWMNTSVFQSPSGNLDFALSANWEALSFNITEVQINYTKTDLVAGSLFKVQNSGQDIIWNVTRTGGFNFYDSRISNFTTINFTIPNSWSNINVFNGITNKTNNVSTRDLGNTYIDVQVSNAGNGTYWFLNATSQNLLSSIKTYVGSIDYAQVNYTNIIDYNITLNNIISNGELNLTVYTPSLNYFNYTTKTSTFDSSLEISIGSWNISKNATEYGTFLVQVYWNNETAAGFLEKNIVIVGDTELIITDPPNNSEYNSSDIFNITIYYNDTGLIQGITSATIELDVDGTSYSPIMFDNGDGYYNISINCSDSVFNGYGWFPIRINASKQNYINQSEILNIKITGETELINIDPLNNSQYYSIDIFNITSYFNDSIKNQPISGATIDVDVNGTVYPTTWDDIGGGYYNISINCSDSIFSSLGWFEIRINASKQSYYNKSAILNIQILVLAANNTEFSILTPSDNSIYNSVDIFNMTVSFNDTTNTQPITGATIEVDVNGTVYTTTWNDIGTGYYNITVNCSDSIFSLYGWFGVRVNISKQGYINQTATLNIKILITPNNTEFSILSPSNNSIYNADDIFNMTVSFNDTTNTQPITGATIEVDVNGTVYTTTWNDIGGGYYNITVNCSESIFSTYGWFGVRVNISKQGYINQTATLNIKILSLYNNSEFAILTPSNNSIYNSVDIFNMTVSFNDTTNTQPITGATIEVDVNGTVYTTTWNDIGAGYYNITVNCSDSIFSSYGWFGVRVNISKQGYINQTATLNIKILITPNNTEFAILSPSNNSIYNADDIFNMTVSFNDTTNTQPISGATIEVDVNGTVYTTTWNDIGGGYYNITVNCSESIFSTYGWFGVRVNISKQGYINQTATLNIKILSLYNNSEFAILTPSNNSIYNSVDIFNMTVSFNDTTNTQPITGATIEVDVNGTVYITTWNDIGGGYYNITVNCSDSIFSLYGWFGVRVNISKQGYINQTATLNIKILSPVNNTEFSILYPSNNSIYNSMAIFNITVSFNDTTNTQPITGATIEVDVNGTIYTTTWNDIGAGYYNITVNCSDSIFNSYGWFSVRVNISKIGYINQGNLLVIKIIGITELYFINPPNNSIYDSGDIFNITVYFNATTKEQPIPGADIKIDVNGTEYITSWYDLGNGEYNITINCTNPIFNGYGWFAIRVNASKQYYMSLSKIINIKVIGLTKIVLINLTQYGQVLSLNNTNYEAFLRENITVYMRYLNYYTNVPIQGALGNLTFNGKSYYNNTDINGLAVWEINTSQLLVDNYNFTISFTLIHYQTNLTKWFFDINRLNISISVINPPAELKKGDLFDIRLLVINDITGDPLEKVNLSLQINFGNSNWTGSNITSLIGFVNFTKITVPLNATKIEMKVKFLGNSTYATLELSFSITLGTSGNGKDEKDDDVPVKPPQDSSFLIIIIILAIVGIVIGGAVVAKSKGKKGKAVPKKEIPKKIPAKKIPTQAIPKQPLPTQPIPAVKPGSMKAQLFKELKEEIQRRDGKQEIIEKPTVVKKVEPKKEPKVKTKPAVVKKEAPKKKPKVKKKPTVAVGEELIKTLKAEKKPTVVTKEKPKIEPKVKTKPAVVKKEAPKKKLKVKKKPTSVTDEELKRSLQPGTKPVPVPKTIISISPIEKEIVEGIILTILQEEKIVRNSEILINKVLLLASQAEVRITQNNIKFIITQMRKDKKISFKSSEGWKL